MQNKRTKKLSLKFKLAVIAVTCWLLPMLLVFSVLVYDVNKNYEDRINNEFLPSVNHGMEIASMHLEQLVEISREASRQSNIRESYKAYVSGKSLEKLSSVTNSFLSKYFRYDDRSIMTVISYHGAADEKFFVYNTRINGSYARYLYYNSSVHQVVLEYAKSLDTKIGFVNHDDNLYMVRNIVDENFDSYAVIVTELNTDYIFEIFDNSDWVKAYNITLNGEGFYIGDGSPEKLDKFATVKLSGNGRAAVKGQDFYGRKSGGAVKMLYLVEVLELKTSELFSNYSVLLFIFIGLLFVLFLTMLYIAYNNVFRPVNMIIDTTKAIENGGYGVQIEDDFDNGEFISLRDAVNHMSTTLQTQFDQIYSEELALRDAKIMALQSQINPHFLNNTLEIINWEARLEGKTNISNMIEALSTMLDAAIDREAAPLIPLKKELKYVDSYLYIVTERFGDRLKFTKKLDPNILSIKVPRLILQPIIENSIEHGMHFSKPSLVTIEGSRLNGSLSLKIINNVSLKEENRKAIAALLSADKGDSEYSTKMGIYNVNSRLKIIYGDDAGLSIYEKDGNTVAEIVIPIKDEYS